MNEEIVDKYRVKETVESLGDFTVVNQFSRNYLYHKDIKIAECINGDYEKRHGGLRGWLSKIMVRENTRLDVIEETLYSLNEEWKQRREISTKIKLILEDKI